MSGSPFLQYNWIDSDCYGPPSSIFYYSNDSYSTILAYINSDTGMEICSTLKLVPENNCCKSSLDISSTMEYQASAGTFDFTGDAYAQLSNSGLYPKATSNKKYCTIEASNSSNVEFQTGFYLNSGQCFEDKIQCLGSKLYLYGGEGCTGTPQVFDFISESNFSSSIIGGFLGKMTSFGAGEMYYTWVSYYPSIYYIPENKEPLELFGTISLVMGIDVYLMLPILVHITIAASYYVCNYFIQYTTIAGNDRAQTGMAYLENFLIAAHMHTNSFSFEYFKTILQRAISNRGKDKSQMDNVQNSEPKVLQKLQVNVDPSSDVNTVKYNETIKPRN
ncbi:hypothetical protein HDV06_001655 [Boothiomyces sp. JEL0866]|nr:hypothetical protein HDV06_001655 [Boothiomyces sp. JEL0866]